MIFLSPAKTLDFDSKVGFDISSELLFADKATYLANKLKKMSAPKLKSLMGISDQLADLNHERFQLWKHPFDGKSKQAVFAFKGDVYQGLEVEKFSKQDLLYAQKHLFILSGLYGLLRPLDLMLPYRLEMGTKWEISSKYKSLYAFWKEDVTAEIQKKIRENNTKFILNLASVEYSKAIDFKKLDIPVIAPEFKEERGGDYKMITFYAKKARGLMASFAIKNKITIPDDLRAFDCDGYGFNARLSNDTNNKWVFTRKTK